VYLQNNHSSLILEEEMMLSIIERGDALYDAEAVLETLEEIESFDILTRRSDFYNKIIDDINAKNPEVLSEDGEKEWEQVQDDAEEEESKASSMSNEEEIDDAARHQHKEACRVKASQGQQKQARRVNACRSNEYKEVLAVGNICLI